jgi:hypothetical protein
MALYAYGNCCVASLQQVNSSSMGSGTAQQQQVQQRYRFMRQLWRLLPAVLLPCASSLLLPGAPSTTQVQGLVRDLLALSKDSIQQQAEILALPGSELLAEALPATLQPFREAVVPATTNSGSRDSSSSCSSRDSNSSSSSRGQGRDRIRPRAHSRSLGSRQYSNSIPVVAAPVALHVAVQALTQPARAGGGSISAARANTK